MLAGDTVSHELAAVNARLQTIDNSLEPQTPVDGMSYFELNIEMREEAGSLCLHELEMALLHGHNPIVPEERPEDASTPSEQDSRSVEDVLQKPDVDRTSHKKGRMLAGLELGWKWTLLPLEIYTMKPGWVTRCLEHPEDSHKNLRVCLDRHVGSAHHIKGLLQDVQSI
jgi:hypothetical protein